ncbi:uncharacterized protein LOC128988575 [Macrosteles quadrilineatus]|uniref:uncharacterized protein LOC128988575 n=1 Tax=Macrosteles quadrilineatus TaxID=74068 RepID=UPI0023E305DA|nr:uncharacterized protein LOC128988575 [Macrosteles quadrilineatus]XP_054265947.1 uncharacterized protein LOC128988575 [Macrosteles quadrilineatus]XP_054265948.1 uncharacterized protein LOC128988575 [Macrosteles quadrilineatus]
MSQDIISIGIPFGLEIEKLYQDLIFSHLQRKPRDSTKRSQLEDLQETKEKLKKELEEARTALSGCCGNIDTLTEEYDRLKKEAEALKNLDNINSRKKADLENELTLLLNIKCNSHDEDLVKKTKLEYKYVRNISQVRFTYDNSDEDVLSGYVFNKSTKNISNFSLNLTKMNQDDVYEHLMLLMKKTSHPLYSGE